MHQMSAVARMKMSVVTQDEDEALVRRRCTKCANKPLISGRKCLKKNGWTLQFGHHEDCTKKPPSSTEPSLISNSETKVTTLIFIRATALIWCIGVSQHSSLNVNPSAHPTRAQLCHKECRHPTPPKCQHVYTTWDFQIEASSRETWHQVTASQPLASLRADLSSFRKNPDDIATNGRTLLHKLLTTHSLCCPSPASVSLHHITSELLNPKAPPTLVSQSQRGRPPDYSTRIAGPQVATVQGLKIKPNCFRLGGLRSLKHCPWTTTNISADWANIIAIIKMSSPRSGRKSRVKISNDDKDLAPPPKCQSILQFTPAIIKRTPCPVNVIICTLMDKLGEPVVKMLKESANKLIRIGTASRTTTSSDKASMTSRRLNDTSAEGENWDGVE
ncbi:hypothetical protein FB451DRAFT_1171727 [Mycena latifolia]|nr:hypothetical protein FB451DRAFT_1171727 [Mycena latifolia]